MFKNCRKINRYGCAICFTTISVLALYVFASCRSIRHAEQVAVHDTLIIHNSDTVREVKVTHHTDTVRQVEKHTYTINNTGDTIREIHHYHDIEHTVVVDSTDRYKAKNDSLQRLLDRERNKEKVVTKNPAFWEHLKDFAIGAFIMLIGLAVLWWKKRS